MSARLIRSILTIAVFFMTASLHAQSERMKKFTDSLVAVLPTIKNDSFKTRVLITITEKKMGEAQNNGNWREAVEWGNKTMVAATKGKNDLVYGRVNIRLGQMFIALGKYSVAMKYLYDALTLSLKNNNLNLRQAAYRNLAICYTNLGNPDEALKMTIKGYEAAAQINNGTTGTLKQIAGEISSAYMAKKNYKEALSWYQKELPEDTSTFDEGALELHYANILLGMNEKEKAIIALKRGLLAFPARFKKPANKYQGLSGSWQMEYGAAYLKLAQLTTGEESKEYYLKANEELRKSIPLLENESGGKEALMTAYQLLQITSEQLGDYVNSLKYHSLYDQIKDSVFSKQAYVQMTELRVKYETEKLASELEAKRERERIQQEVDKSRLLAEQKLKQEQLISREKLAYEKQTAQRQLEQEKILSNQKLLNEKAIEEEKRKEAALRAEKERTNNLLLMGLSLTIITSVFIFLYTRQRNQKKRVLEHAEAMHKMAELELQSLRSQLNPHFMFNSLTSIQELILKEENDKSHLYLSRFAKLLRMLLEHADQPFISVQKELEFLRIYIELENLRVPDLHYSIDTDPKVNTQSTMIPNMMLQPYIENAIWHGLSAKRGNKQLQIRIYPENGTINYEIEDNGIGRQKALEIKTAYRESHQSKGMEILNKRFELLGQEYGTMINTTVSDVVKSGEVSGTLVQIKVPVELSQPHLN